jgi:DNA transformation protein and related proteins
MNEFVDYLHEVFELFGPIRARKMFSGYGIYHNGLMFGLVAGDTLYLKADAENANHFEKEGLGRFVVQQRRKGSEDVLLLCASRDHGRPGKSRDVGAPLV